MKRYEIEELMDEDLMMELTEHAFSKDNVRNSDIRNVLYVRFKRLSGAAAACIMLALVLTNFDSVMAAARNFITYIIGQETEQGTAPLCQYEVLQEPVLFEDDDSYRVDMAYRKNNSLFFIISSTDKNAKLQGALEVSIEGTTYYGKQVGGYSSASKDTETGTRTYRTEKQYMLEQAPQGQVMTLGIDGRRAVIALKTSPEYAVDTQRIADLGWLKVEFIPLTPDRQILGYTTETKDEILKDAYFYFPYGKMTDSNHKEIDINYLGGKNSFSHELAAETQDGLEITAFSSDSIHYRLGGTHDCDLGEYRFEIPEQGKTKEVDDVINIAGIEMHLNTITWTEENQIRFSFISETNRGTLSGMWLNEPSQTSSGAAFSVEEDTFDISIDWSEYRIDEDGNKTLITQFPYQAGDEMTVCFQMIEGAMSGDIRVLWEK